MLSVTNRLGIPRPIDQDIYLIYSHKSHNLVSKLPFHLSKALHRYSFQMRLFLNLTIDNTLSGGRVFTKNGGAVNLFK